MNYLVVGIAIVVGALVALVILLAGPGIRSGDE